MSLVPGYGPLNAKIVIVGEAPGVEEERQGKPFIGGSGQVLSQVLASAGIDRSQCYITNVVKARPPGNNFDIYYEDGAKKRIPSQLLLNSISALHKEIEPIRPNVIFALGNEALRALTGKQGITKWRGSIIPTPLGKVIPSLHPAYILRVYSDRPILEFDAKRLSKESVSPDPNLPIHNFILSPTLEQVKSYLSMCMQSKRISFDIETVGRRIRCLGLSCSPSTAICIPFMNSPLSIIPGSTTINFTPSSANFTSYWSLDDEYLILSLLNQLFLSTSVSKVAQNLAFDTTLLGLEFGHNFSSLSLDTMAMQHTCYPELPKGLDFLCSLYTRVPYYSDYDVSNDQQVWRYNCYDASVTLECSYALDKELADLGLTEFYHSHVHPAILAVTRAQNRGVLINAKDKEEWRQRQEILVGDLVKRLRELTGRPDFNPNSSPQLCEYLYGTLGLPVQRNPKTKQRTADKNAINALQRDYPQHGSFFELAAAHSKESTLLTSFLNKKLSADSKLYTGYSVTGTITGRLSSSDPIIFEGTNLQNIPRGEFRRLFISAPGWVFIKADLSQAEFRIVTWLAPIPRIIELYRTNPRFDVHKWNAAENIFRIPLESVTKDQRKIAKDGVYGGNYRMQDKKAALVYKMPLETARFVLQRYRQGVPEIPLWWQKVETQLNTTRTIVSPLGRKRIFFGRFDDEMYRAGYSHSAQNIVGDIINRAFTVGDAIFDPNECYPLLQVHDEIVWHCRADKVEAYVPTVREIMEYSVKFPEVEQELKIPVDISVGVNWFDQKELAHG